jgi:hypothetical protein
MSARRAPSASNRRTAYVRRALSILTLWEAARLAGWPPLFQLQPTSSLLNPVPAAEPHWPVYLTEEGSMSRRVTNE